MKRIFFTIILSTFAINLFAPPLAKVIFKENLERPIKLDAQILAFMVCLRFLESSGNYQKSGASGEYGAYQIMPSTWQKYCTELFGRVFEPTEYNQDMIVYWKLKGLSAIYNVNEIAAIWNSGKPTWIGRKGVNKFGVKYDVEAYVRNFNRKLKEIRL
jgi:hypothetical protein